MSSTNPAIFHAVDSTGHEMVEANWLDVHFEASRREYEAMIRSVGIREGWTVLDAGCGGGSFVPLLAELVGPNGRIHALDLAPENVRRVKERALAGEFACPVAARTGSIVELPFANDAFDAVWCANVVQYLDEADFARTLAEFRRVVRPGGVVAVKEFDTSALYIGPFDVVLWRRMFEARRRQSEKRGCLYTVQHPSWFHKAGFTDVRFETVVGNRQHPLRPVEVELLRTNCLFYASLAERAGLPEHELEVWRRKMKDLDGPEHVLSQPDFYFREVHGLVVGRVPP